MVAGSHDAGGRGSVGRSDWDGIKDGAVKTRRTSHSSLLSTYTSLVVTLDPYRQRHSGLKQAGQHEDTF